MDGEAFCLREPTFIFIAISMFNLSLSISPFVLDYNFFLLAKGVVILSNRMAIAPFPAMLQVVMSGSDDKKWHEWN
jgi:hypothetical protein